MSSLNALKSCKSLSDFALLLGYQPSALAFLLYKMPEDEKYKEFFIQKRSGGERKINAPVKKIKKLQRRLLELLENCECEISEGKIYKRTLSHAFKKGLSIKTNTTSHIGRRYVLNIDLKDFFPTINFGRVRGYFIKNRDYALRPNIATIIAQIVCYKNALPQGGPCSPLISDFIARSLDFRLLTLAANNGCHYSRYADDITISTDLKKIPHKIASQKYLDTTRWMVGAELQRTVEGAGFQINFKKTRVQYRESRQTVTGLVVNKKLNVRREYFRKVRILTHELLKTGSCYEPLEPVNHALPKPPKLLILTKSFFRKLSGFLGFSSQVNKRIENKRRERGDEVTIQQLEGMFAHIYDVKRRPEGTIEKQENHHLDRGFKETQNRAPLYKRLYSDVLFFKLFYKPDLPTVYCEGLTDVIYLKSALIKLANNYPDLIVKKDGKWKFLIKFYRHTKVTKDLLIRSEGTSGQAALFHLYSKYIPRIKAPMGTNPVILLCDNDKGLDSVIKALPNTKVIDRLKLSHNLRDNLFLILTPISKIGDESKIEDLFEEKVLSTEIDGRVFNSENTNFDKATEYGKYEFSQYVRKNQNVIKFDGFKPILDTVVSIIKSYP